MTNVSATEERYYTVRVTCLVAEEDRDEEDRDVPEEWTTELPAGSENWTPSQCATYVLDEFHDSVAVAVLDDFQLTVIGPDGEEICEDEEPDEAPSRKLRAL